MLRRLFIFLLVFVSFLTYSQTGTISDGELGSSVRTKINATITKANNHADSIVVYRSELDNLTDSIDAHDGKINTNITNIATNVTNIATNVSDIDTLQYTVGDSATVSWTTNTINELTGGSGVTVDGGLIKDNRLGSSSAYFDYGYLEWVFIKTSGSNPSGMSADGNYSLTISPDILNGLYGQVLIEGDLDPIANNTYDFGNSSLEWRNVWVDTIRNSGTLYFDDGSNTPKTLAELAETCNANDSITVHRTALDNATDSLAVHLDTLQALRADINNRYTKTASFTSCDDDTTTYLTIGDTGDYSFLLHYVAYRTMASVVTYQSGTIQVLYNPSTAGVFYTNDYVGGNIGTTLEADVNSGNLRLKVIVDAANTNNTFFDYRVYSKFK